MWKASSLHTVNRLSPPTRESNKGKYVVEIMGKVKGSTRKVGTFYSQESK